MLLYNANRFEPPLTSDNVEAKVNAHTASIFTSVNYADKSNLKWFLDANKMYQ